MILKCNWSLKLCILMWRFFNHCELSTFRYKYNYLWKLENNNNKSNSICLDFVVIGKVLFLYSKVGKKRLTAVIWCEMLRSCFNNVLIRLFGNNNSGSSDRSQTFRSYFRATFYPLECLGWMILSPSTASLSRMEDKYISWPAVVFHSEALLIGNIQG